MKTTLRLIAAGLLLGLAACTQPPLPEDHYYRLSVEAPAKAAAPVLAGTVEVERLLADGLTAGRPIVYSEADKPNQLFEYHYHFWIEAPTTMLQDQIVDFLRDGGLATSVVTPDMRVSPDYVITGRIRNLEQLRGSARAVIELELGVRGAEDNKLVTMGTYREEATTTGDSVEETVAALNAALGKIMGRFAADLKAAH